jgi:hypothetical protein
MDFLGTVYTDDRSAILLGTVKFLAYEILHLVWDKHANRNACISIIHTFTELLDFKC